MKNLNGKLSVTQCHVQVKKKDVSKNVGRRLMNKGLGVGTGKVQPI